MKPCILHEFLYKTTFALSLLTFVFSFPVYSEAERRPTYGISQTLSNKLQKVDALINGADGESNGSENNTLALKQSLQLLENCTRCNPYELATLHRYAAWLSFQVNELQTTILHYRAVVDLSPEIPLSFEQDALLALTKIYFQEAKYSNAISTLTRWKQLASAIPADIYEMEARINYMMEDYPKALHNISLAINEVENQIENKTRAAPEAWYLFQRSLYYSKEDFKACLSVQRKLAEHYSKDAHWRDLAVFFGLVGDENEQLAAYDVAWLLEGLSQESDIVNFAWLLQNADYPYKAALVLQAAMKKGVIANSYRNLELLARAWYLSHEHGRAIAAMESAVQLSPNGNGFSFLTDLYMEADLFAAAIENANRGLNTGDLKSPGRLHLNKGIALLYLQRFDAANAAFQSAKNDKSTVELADKWIQQCHSERRRYEELNLVLAISE